MFNPIGSRIFAIHQFTPEKSKPPFFSSSEVHVVLGEHAAGGVAELSRVPVHVDVLVVVGPVVAGRRRVGPVVLELVVVVEVVVLVADLEAVLLLLLVIVIAERGGASFICAGLEIRFASATGTQIILHTQ